MELWRLECRDALQGVQLSHGLGRTVPPAAAAAAAQMHQVQPPLLLLLLPQLRLLLLVWITLAVLQVVVWVAGCWGWQGEH